MSANKNDELPVTFIAKGKATRLVRVRQRTVLVQGDRVELEGLAYDFEPGGGRLVVTEELVERDRAFFEEQNANSPLAQDPRTLEWLRNHHLCGDRFFEMTPPVPASTDTIVLVAEVAAAGDVDRLLELRDEEERGHNRQDVIRVIDASLAKLEEQVPAGPPAG